MDNMDLPPAAGQTMAWYQVWMQVVTHPSRDSFRRILADPNAKPARAFIWVAIIGVIFGLLELVINQVFRTNVFPGSASAGVLRFITSGVCIFIAIPIFSVAGLALGAAILRGIAALLKGTGNFNDLVYCLGAVQAPLSIISSLFSLIIVVANGGSPFLAAGAPRSIIGLCLLPFSLAVGIYAVVLEVLAVDTVEKFGTGKAVLTVLIPVIVVFLLAACIAALVFVAYTRQVGS